MENLETEKEKFQIELRDLAETFLTIRKFDDFNRVKEYAQEVYTLNEKL